MTHCPSSERLAGLLADRLGGAEACAVEAHVEACSDCQQALERLTGGQEEKSLAAPEYRDRAAAETGGDFLRQLEQEPPAGAAPHARWKQSADSAGKPAAIPKPLLPGEPTADERGPELPSPVQPGRMGVAFVPGPTPPSALEIQHLLRGRLRAAFLIITVAFGIISVLGTVNVALQPTIPPRVILWFSLFSGPCVALAGLTALLCSRRPLSLTQLRAAELTLVVIFAAGCALKQTSYFDAARPLAETIGDGGVVILSGYHSLFWFALLTIYGLFIPNTWRRCALVVGLIAACPFAVVLVQGLGPGLEITGRPLLYYVTVLGFWVLLGAALAVFGSHHFQVLRRAARAVRQLGQYQLKMLLGAGGMGEVYLAEHVLLKRPCAVKLIRPERAGDPRNLVRFEREVRATATLTHPNTVEVYDYGHAEDGTFYYAMEYLPGLSLEQLVQRHGPLPPARAVHLLRQVCGALGEAHTANLIHRDIKPSNILVCERGGLCDVAKLLDFGLVQTHELKANGSKLTQEGALAGTPAYMSPEQAAGKAELDGRSDLYSLGAVAYFLLTGEPPFVRDTAVQTLAAHLSEAPAPPSSHCPDIPADLEAIVLRCLAKKPGQRFPSADELEQALAQCDCADRWTREESAAWWREYVAANEPAALQVAGGQS